MVHRKTVPTEWAQVNLVLEGSKLGYFSTVRRMVQIFYWISRGMEIAKMLKWDNHVRK